jgi:periplasmic protein TonB
MFTVVVRRRKRRAWSTWTVAVSVGAHLLVLAGIAAAAANTGVPPGPERRDTTIRWLPLKKPDPPLAPKPTPRLPSTRPKPVPGRTLALQPPSEVPRALPLARPDLHPVNPDDYTGVGPVGNVIGPPPATPQPPAPGPPPPDDGPDEPLPSSAVEQLPQLLNPREAQRILERVYPGLLRDAGVTGHTTVLLVIDRDGMVEPGSVTVQETSHDAFRAAAVRAAERFRFHPAKVNGQPVPVRISIPIEWTIAP